jgi:hypothetical protein
MANTLRIKRRWTGLAGPPVSLKSAELSYNGVDDTLYIGFGDDGSGNATSIKGIAGFGAYVGLTGDQIIAGIKTFSSIPVIPQALDGDNSNQAANTAFVQNAILDAIAAVSISDGNYGDIVVSGSGSVWTITSLAVDNSKLAEMPANTLKGNDTGASDSPVDLTVGQVRTMLSINLVDNTSDVDKPISDATQAALDNKIPSADIGAAGGVAPLDGTTKIPAIYLPSYVDDVIEVANFAALPAVGEAGKIYVTLDDNKQYRWGGSVYVEMVSSPGTTDDVPEGSTNLYYTTARARGDTLAATIVNGDTTHAPTGDAVYDALLNYQPSDPTLTAFAALTIAANKGIYGTGADAFATYDLTAGGRALGGVAGTTDTFPYFSAANTVSLQSITAAGRALLDDADNTAQRTTLGLGTMAVQNANAVAITGGTIDNIVIDGGTY